MHPGFAKDKMENAIKIAARHRRPPAEGHRPETTDGTDGFIHPADITGSMEKAGISFIIRDFAEEGLPKRKPCWRRSSRP